EAGHLHDDAVRALADDRRLARPERVDALAHHFGRAFHRVRGREVEAGTGPADDEAAAGDDLAGPVTLPGPPGAGGQRPGDAAPRVDVAGSFEQEREAVARGGDVTNANPRLGGPQCVADALLHRLEPLHSHLARIRLEQDVA